MNKQLLSIITLAVITLTLACATSTNVSAADITCPDLVKECFAYGETERSDCFQKAANHSKCSNTDLGKLTLERLHMSPTGVQGDEAFALLGPESFTGDVVNQDCLANFDAQLSSSLVSGSLTDKAISNLKLLLSNCRPSTVIDKLQP